MFLFFKGDPTSKCFSLVIIWIFFCVSFFENFNYLLNIFRSGTLLETRELVSLIETRNYLGLIYSITIPSMLFIILHNDGYIVDILKNKSRLVIMYLANNRRSNHLRCSVKKGFLNNFANFTGKCLCWIVNLQVQPVNIAKFLRTPLVAVSVNIETAWSQGFLKMTNGKNIIFSVKLY